MPSSNFGHLLDVLQVVTMLNPYSVLDIGVGFGKYGFLLRELLDLKPGEEGGYAKWAKKIDGIEIDSRYLTPVHKYIYDKIFLGDALTIIEKMDGMYDCIIAIDVLEHFRKKDAYKFINYCQDKGRNFLIATPYVYFDQGEVFKNPYEEHLSGWTIHDLKKAGAKYLWRSGLAVLALFTANNLPFPAAEIVSDQTLSNTDIINFKSMLAMYIKTGQVEECRDASSQYLELIPDDMEVLLLNALCLEIQGDYLAAANKAIRALEINGENQVARAILNRCMKNGIINAGQVF
ncbi:hypothetical protein SDD30_13655 [Moorella naiadis]|uniref:hypothetical protein n=1 Tax=Moorella naiadis (nom. illeg.) TaxID=3093670 RepID=UPI003D9C8F8E